MCEFIVKAMSDLYTNVSFGGGGGGGGGGGWTTSTKTGDPRKISRAEDTGIKIVSGAVGVVAKTITKNDYVGVAVAGATHGALTGLMSTSAGYSDMMTAP